MKKAFEVFFSVIISFMLFSDRSLSQTTENDPNMGITGIKNFYVNSIKELQSIEDFNDIRLKAGAFEIQPTDSGAARSRAAGLSVEKAGETIFYMTSSNFFDPNGSSLWNTLQIVPTDPNSSALLCGYLMSKSGKIGAITLSQQDPTGVAGVLRESDERWHLFQYTVKPEGIKRPYYDIYFDIDFDGFLDVRDVVDTKLKKIIRSYIMYDMEWIKVDKSVDVYKKVPVAKKTDSGKKFEYEYLDGLWKIKN